MGTAQRMGPRPCVGAGAARLELLGTGATPASAYGRPCPGSRPTRPCPDDRPTSGSSGPAPTIRHG